MRSLRLAALSLHVHICVILLSFLSLFGNVALEGEIKEVMKAVSTGVAGPCMLARAKNLLPTGLFWLLFRG